MKRWKKLSIVLGTIFSAVALPSAALSCVNNSATSKNKKTITNENENNGEKPGEKPNANKPNSPQGDPNSRAGEDVPVDPAGTIPRLPGSSNGGGARNATIPLDSNGNPMTSAEFAKLPDENAKYNVEENAYVTALNGVDGVPDSFDRSNFDKARFDANAAQNDLPSFEDSLIKDFSVPNKQGKLVINPKGGTAKGPYWQSDLKDVGKSRWIPNQDYMDLLHQSFRITIANNNPITKTGKAEWGTAWILDYVPTENGSYPTKWYLGTNLHVAMALRQKKARAGDVYSIVENNQGENDAAEKAAKKLEEAENNFKIKAVQLNHYDSEKAAKNLDPYDHKAIENDPQMREVLVAYDKAFKDKAAADNANQGITNKVVLERFNKDTPLKEELQFTYQSPFSEKFELDPDNVKLVYAAIDFMKTSPSTYMADEHFKTLQEMADFAVLEIDFTKSDNRYKITKNNLRVQDQTERFVNTPQDFARIATNDFADLSDEKQPKPANFDMLQKYEELSNQNISVDFKGKQIPTKKINVDLMALGFPNAEADNQGRDSMFITDDERRARKGAASIWINKPYNIDDDQNRKTTLDKGYSLSRSLAVRNFKTKPGIFDLTIVSPTLNGGKSGFFVPKNLKEKDAEYTGNEYLNYGLGYSLTSWHPLGGASGSQIRDIDKNIIGINFAAADDSGVSLLSYIQALRSNGVDYHGTYGDYKKLEQYDLIYGGGENQRTSYRQALEKLYNSQYKTHLFKQGVSVLPDEYKFKK
ncbi:Ig-specific serine endopeptidase MIP [Mycoplasma struthionis]|uniref:DUF31 domain-containing protein n=1 Tax=Mycoplasma struthionis TaxID=538220 RepID=A0A502M6D4_9MOLU|nr:DUF31 family protein [Mycoplasma struthionis]TPI02283.1 hypothetical protein FJM01_01285 [Mycoplasma struthionis]